METSSLILSVFISRFILSSAYDFHRDSARLTLLHNNDLHAKFEEISATSSICTDHLRRSEQCYGGFARTAHIIRKLRKQATMNEIPPVIYLFAGDLFSGSNLFDAFRGEICSKFINFLSPDVMTLGNHEFDDGLDGVSKYLDDVDVNTTTVLANVQFPTKTNIKSSTVLHVNGISIGIIGALTPETKTLSNTPEGVIFKQEIEAINAEAKILTEHGVKILIALTHSGYEVDKEIARKCPEIDLVVGGHSHSFLGNAISDAKHPEYSNIEGPYPTFVKQDNEKLVPVVQAYANSKYLGRLELEFSKAGHLIEAKGSPILLDSTIPQDQDVLNLLNDYKTRLPPEDEIIGHTKVQLDGVNECKNGECNLGNLITDALVYCRIKALSEIVGKTYYTDAPIAFTNAGGIRSSIDKKPGGAITVADIKLVLPFAGTYKVVQISGKSIRKALEHSASEYGANNAAGGILQMAGVRVEFNMNRPVGDRVGKVMILCAECNIPAYYQLVGTNLYNILVSDYLYGGGGGYDFKENGVNEPLDLGKIDRECVIEYIRDHEIIYPMLEGRMTFSK